MAVPDFDRARVLFVDAGAKPIRIWNGAVSLTGLPFDPEGVYSGSRPGGRLLSVPTLAGGVAGLTQRVEIGVSSLDPQVMAMIAAGPSAWKDADVTLMLGCLKPGTIEPHEDYPWPLRVHRYVLDSTWEETTKQGGVELVQRKLGCASALTRRRGSDAAYWTDPDHRRDHPDDTVMTQLAGYAPGKNKIWGGGQ